MKVSSRDAWKPIQNRQDFKTHGSLWGTNRPALYTGMLDGYDMSEYRNKYEDIDFVVMSYQTPIAWHYKSADFWYIVRSKFSVTTSKHQTLILKGVI
jgi:hypothetical protein